VRGRSAGAAFVGRSGDLEVLLDAYAHAGRGEGAVVLVGGEAGVGKSRLVGEAAGHARRHGARVLVGQCLDLEEGGLPYAPLVDMLRALDRDLTPEEGSATLGPLRAFLGRTGEGGTPEGTAPGVAGPAGQARLFELLLTVIERLVALRPVVLVFEDLHWADRSTLDLVALIASSTRTLPVCTIGTYRSEDVPPRHPLRQLTAELTRRGARHLELGRLGAGDVAELLGALLGSPPAPELVASVVERSDGNPLFVEELAAGLADDPGAPMPPHLRDAVVSRVERMPVGAAAVLRTCAVGGREVEHDLLAEMVGAGGDTDPGALDRDLRTCVESGLLVADQQRGSYRFRHALVHEAVLADVLPGELHRLHRACATALAERQRSTPGVAADQWWSRLARHWAGAGDFDAALGAAVRAGRAAEAAFAVPEAHRSLEWSVRLWDRAADPEAAAACRRDELLAAAADAANRSGLAVRALTLVDEALAIPAVADDPVRAGLLHERRGWYLYRTGRADDALAAYELAVELVPAKPPTAARARVVQAHAHALVRAGRAEAARPRAEEAVALARSVADRVDEGQATHVVGLVLASEGRTDDAIAQLHEAGQIAAELGDLAEVAGAYVHLWRTLVEAGRGDDLIDLVLGFDTGAAGVASDAPAPTLMGTIGAAALHQLGRWDEAEHLLGDGLAAAEVGGLTAITRTLVAGALAVDRGDHEQARDDLEIARAWCHQVGDGRLNGLLHRALAELAAWQGRTADARREVDTGLELLAHTGDPELAARIAAVGVRAEADGAQAGGRTGRSPTAEAKRRTADLVRRLEDLARTAGGRTAPAGSEAIAALRTGRAEASRLEGAGDPAAWVEAVAAWEAIAFPYPVAYARLRLTEAALGAGDEGTAAAALAASWETASSLRAGPLAAALTRLARRARIALPGAEAGVADTGTGGGGDRALTPREREVLGLVAAGRTNRQIGEELFISQKTASVHVSRLLAKLGASTRGEAAAIARREGLLDERGV
jgi:DNA-binding CsgD family transcriptional regulator/tetratricopeptide (TPR) repeat protein